MLLLSSADNLVVFSCVEVPCWPYRATAVNIDGFESQPPQRAPAGEVLVGHDAVKRLQKDPLSTFYSVKRLIVRRPARKIVKPLGCATGSATCWPARRAAALAGARGAPPPSNIFPPLAACSRRLGALCGASAAFVGPHASAPVPTRVPPPPSSAQGRKYEEVVNDVARFPFRGAPARCSALPLPGPARKARSTRARVAAPPAHAPLPLTSPQRSRPRPGRRRPRRLPRPRVPPAAGRDLGRGARRPHRSLRCPLVPPRCLLHHLIVPPLALAGGARRRRARLRRRRGPRHQGRDHRARLLPRAPAVRLGNKNRGDDSQVSGHSSGAPPLLFREGLRRGCWRTPPPPVSPHRRRATEEAGLLAGLQKVRSFPRRLSRVAQAFASACALSVLPPRALRRSASSESPWRPRWPTVRAHFAPTAGAETRHRAGPPLLISSRT